MLRTAWDSAVDSDEESRLDATPLRKKERIPINSEEVSDGTSPLPKKRNMGERYSLESTVQKSAATVRFDRLDDEFDDLESPLQRDSRKSISVTASPIPEDVSTGTAPVHEVQLVQKHPRLDESEDDRLDVEMWSSQQAGGSELESSSRLDVEFRDRESSQLDAGLICHFSPYSESVRRQRDIIAPEVETLGAMGGRSRRKNRNVGISQVTESQLDYEWSTANPGSLSAEDSDPYVDYQPRVRGQVKQSPTTFSPRETTSIEADSVSKASEYLFQSTIYKDGDNGVPSTPLTGVKFIVGGNPRKKLDEILGALSTTGSIEASPKFAEYHERSPLPNRPPRPPRTSMTAELPEPSSPDQSYQNLEVYHERSPVRNRPPRPPRESVAAEIPEPSLQDQSYQNLGAYHERSPLPNRPPRPLRTSVAAEVSEPSSSMHDNSILPLDESSVSVGRLQSDHENDDEREIVARKPQAAKRPPAAKGKKVRPRQISKPSITSDSLSLAIVPGELGFALKKFRDEGPSHVIEGGLQITTEIQPLPKQPSTPAHQRENGRRRRVRRVRYSPLREWCGERLLTDSKGNAIGLVRKHFDGPGFMTGQARHPVATAKAKARKRASLALPAPEKEDVAIQKAKMATRKVAKKSTSTETGLAIGMISVSWGGLRECVLPYSTVDRIIPWRPHDKGYLVKSVMEIPHDPFSCEADDIDCIDIILRVRMGPGGAMVEQISPNSLWVVRLTDGNFVRCDIRSVGETETEETMRSAGNFVVILGGRNVSIRNEQIEGNASLQVFVLNKPRERLNAPCI